MTYPTPARRREWDRTAREKEHWPTGRPAGRPDRECAGPSREEGRALAAFTKNKERPKMERRSVFGRSLFFSESCKTERRSVLQLADADRRGGG